MRIHYSTLLLQFLDVDFFYPHLLAIPFSLIFLLLFYTKIYIKSALSEQQKPSQLIQNQVLKIPQIFSFRAGGGCSLTQFTNWFVLPFLGHCMNLLFHVRPFLAWNISTFNSAVLAPSELSKPDHFYHQYVELMFDFSDSSTYRKTSAV